MAAGLLETVQDTIRKYRMTEPGQTVLCALSGGVDSVCMTHILASLRPQLGIRLCAAHFSHGIRPEAAEEERLLVQSLCQSLGIELRCGRGDAPALAQKQGISVENAARTLRYVFLRRAAEETGSARIATAHHRDDNCETVLLNLVRGSGTVGLGGIPPVRDEFIRPLIGLTRAQIEAYAGRNNLRWAQDMSNFDQRIPRNRVRHTVMPALQSINPQAAANIARAAELARLDGEFLELCANRLADQAVRRKNGIELQAAVLAQAHPAVAGRAVRLLYVRAGGRVGVFTLRHAQAVLALCAGASPSARADLPGGMIAYRRYDALVLETAHEKQEPLPCIRLEPGQTVKWGQWQLCLSPTRWQDWPMAAFLAPDGTENGLFVRPRASGDIIVLSGGHRSVKRWMIDRKIPQKDRDRMPVLCDNKKIRALFWDRAYTIEKEKKDQAVVVAARRDEK